MWLSSSKERDFSSIESYFTLHNIKVYTHLQLHAEINVQHDFQTEMIGSTIFIVVYNNSINIHREIIDGSLFDERKYFWSS